ncbi:MAG TPA: hypothetical protein VEL76_02905 [Gemmataceae bacterium]|nr:hypothetical protein [Gemmataceae bacterium]
MYFLARLTLIASIFGLLVTGLCHTRPAWLADLGLDIWTYPELLEQVEQQQERGRHLTAALALTQERMRLKEEATKALIEGRQSLWEVASLFRSFSDHIPAFADYLRSSWPEQSESERLCRYAIRCVQWALADEPERASGVLARLERELDAKLRQ